MPVFQMGDTNLGLSINDDSDVLNFLTSGGNSEYVDARTALKNSDIYSLVYQLSADLADANLVADSSRTQGILDNPSNTANRLRLFNV